MSDDSQKLGTGESGPPAAGEGERLAPSSTKAPAAANAAANEDVGDPGVVPAVERLAEVERSKLTSSEVEIRENNDVDPLTDEDAVTTAGEEIEYEETADGETADDESADDETADDESADDESESDEDVEPLELISEEDDVTMGWYILKVQSNRERSIAASLKRKVAIEGLDRYFGDILVPTEKVTEFKGGKKKIVERKLYPGYIVVQMHINDDTWFAVRETSGIGDFTGAGGKPTPMLAHEVARIVQAEEEETDEAPKLDIKFKQEDKVKVKEGTFEGFEGNVSAIDEQSGKITVMINIFGRSTPVELEYWQVEGV